MKLTFHLRMWSQKPPEAVSEVVNFKIVWKSMPPDPLVWVRYGMLEFPPSTKKILY